MKHITKEQLERMYLRKKMSMSYIAFAFGTSFKKIKEVMIDYQIPIRPKTTP